MNDVPFQHLRHLMGAYFNQDYDLHGDNDAEILQAFKRCLRPDELKATLQEVDYFLSLSVQGLRERYAGETDAWDYDVGEDDASTREWLIQARTVLLG